MPILDICIIGELEPVLLPQLPEHLAAAAGHVFKAEPGCVWVTVRVTPLAAYAENDTGTWTGPGPVFVRVVKRIVQDSQTLESEAQALAMAIGEVTRIPSDRVHIIYEPSAVGRVAFGGRLVT